MSNFDDFLKRTEDELKMAREAAKTNAETEAQYNSRLAAALKIGWEQLFKDMNDFCAGKEFDGKKFFPQGTASMMLGSANVSLLTDRSRREVLPIYKAIYKTTYQNIHSEDVILDPDLDGSDLRWKVSASKPAVSTEQLAEVLIWRLVEVYKDGQLASLKS
jgi:hypothetical protein